MKTDFGIISQAYTCRLETNIRGGDEGQSIYEKIGYNLF